MKFGTTITQLFNPKAYEKRIKQGVIPSESARATREPKKRIFGELPMRLQGMIPEVPFDKIYCYPLGHTEMPKLVNNLSLADIIDALDRASGKLYLAARLLEVRHSVLINLVNKEDEIGEFLREVIESIEGELLDEIELRLLRCCQNLESWAIKFFLSGKGKIRGYGENQQSPKTTIVIKGDIPEEEYQ